MKFGKDLRGFTLIEVMLAMTLLSIIMILLTSALTISAQSWDVGEDKIAQADEIALVYNFFQRQLVSARPLWQDVPATDPESSLQDSPRTFSFQGSSSSLQFVSAFPASAARAGLQLFTIEKAQSQDRENAIIVTIIPFFPAAEGAVWEPEHEILIDRVRSFELAYFGRDDESGTRFWHDDWLDRKTLPSLVSIRITRDDEAFWPEMVIAVKSAEMPLEQEQQLQQLEASIE